jgi:uncharacterized protein YqjF (DUF2071 family)
VYPPLNQPPAPPVSHPVMCQDWRTLTFLHWRYPPEIIQELLPAGLEVDAFDGDAWVGLIPFLMDQVRPPRAPALPWLSRFPETNVRTYVRGPDGHTGIWFFSLEAARLPAVLAGRMGFGLPYQWAKMSLRSVDDAVAYHSRRRWPGLRGAYCDAQIELGEPFPEAELGSLDHFLTARFRLYSVLADRLVAADAEHPPWPLRHAWLGHLRQNLIQVAGLPTPRGQPLMHASDGVRVRIGMWHPVRAAARPASTAESA